MIRKDDQGNPVLDPPAGFGAPTGAGTAGSLQTGADGQPVLMPPPVAPPPRAAAPGVAPQGRAAAAMDALLGAQRADPNAVREAVEAVSEEDGGLDPIDLLNNIGRILINQCYGEEGLDCSLACATTVVRDRRGRIMEAGWAVNLILPTEEVVVYEGGIDDLGTLIERAMQEAPRHLQQASAQAAPRRREREPERVQPERRRSEPQPQPQQHQFGALRRR
jgi:hypothetical protein